MRRKCLPKSSWPHRGHSPDSVSYSNICDLLGRSRLREVGALPFRYSGAIGLTLRHRGRSPLRQKGHSQLGDRSLDMWQFSTLEWRTLQRRPEFMAGSRIAAWVASVILFGFLASTLSAQISQGGVAGTVKDNSGAVVPNAHITLTNKATNVSLATQSTSSGTYVLGTVPVGTYTRRLTLLASRPTSWLASKCMCKT